MTASGLRHTDKVTCHVSSSSRMDRQQVAHNVSWARYAVCGATQMASSPMEIRTLKAEQFCATRHSGTQI
jgi:hypothetical protein